MYGAWCGLPASNGERERERERLLLLQCEFYKGNDSLTQFFFFFFKNFHAYPLFHILIVDIDYLRFKMCKILSIIVNIVCTSV